jgi:CubicO group peptidase (beta-lactamase class C family)
MVLLRRMVCCRSFPLSLIVLTILAGSAPAQQTDTLDSLLKDAVSTFQVPGLAVAVVREEEVLYLKGVGVRKINTTDPVTPDTLFSIASLTKAFTAASLGVLVDEGKAGWDDPVRKHLPWFHLSDPLADRDVTLRDLLCHRTGLSRHDLLWQNAPWSVEETVKRMAHLEPDLSFRSTYRYANLPYMAAGLAIASTAKTPWQDVVRTRLFEPLEMKNSVFTRTEAENIPDHATPHHRLKKPLAMGAPSYEAIPWYPDDKQIRGSGSIKSSVRDLTHWLQMQLNGGVYKGKRVISARALAETHRPQIVGPIDPDRARLAVTTLSSYGLGFHISDYRGQTLLEHGGAADGFRARLMLLPKAKIGLILLTNIDDGVILQALGNDMADHLLGLPKKDWIAYYRDRRRDDAPISRLPARVAKTKPSHELEAFTGAYEDPAYGKLRITLAEGKLRLAWSSFRVDLEHYHFDSFVVTSPGRLHEELATFTLQPSGAVGSLRFLERTFKRIVEP